MGVINTKKSLTGFANAAHRAKQLLGSCEITCLRFVSIIPKSVNVAYQSIAAAEQAATLGRMLKPGVSLNLRSYRVSDFYQPAHAPDSITIGRERRADVNLNSKIVDFKF